MRGLSGARIVRFAVIGDSHIGYPTSLPTFKHILMEAVRTGNKRFVIFGGDNKHGSSGASAEADYLAFKETVTEVLGPRKIRYKASIGNWETNTRGLFRRYLGDVYGIMTFPGTQGRVKYVWLDNAIGRFSQASLSLLKGLDANSYYIINCHWPLRVNGISIDSSQMISQQETDRFFEAIPPHVRNKVLAIFTHHAHLFCAKQEHIYPGFPFTQYYVCGCSGAYKCPTDETGFIRGYYDASIVFRNRQAGIVVRHVQA
ncbi:metallophosphoesterase family protein [Paenibacillus aestuarii]|uniref:Metallophosphoesterase family protein n=1 Tax=Paenibacillus aestuarii TaxID=516965 RepID=A0ABW0KHY3_9BACL|nr:metallophosphoesterase [Paenibacillus aestuarii]